MANKEHIYQFAVSLDEDFIVRQMVNNLEKEMKDQTRKNIEETMFNRWGDTRQWIKDILTLWLNENKETILDKTAALLVEKLYRTKAVKEMVARIGQESGEVTE